MDTKTATKTYGFEWRTLLGPTNDWPSPAIDSCATTEKTIPMERCELCGEQCDDAKLVTANSSGQRVIHIACLDDSVSNSMSFGNRGLSQTTKAKGLGQVKGMLQHLLKTTVGRLLVAG